jgi:hypothetical protein
MRTILAIIFMTFATLTSATPVQSEKVTEQDIDIQDLLKFEHKLKTGEANAVMSKGTILAVIDKSEVQGVTVVDFIVSYKDEIWGCRSVVIARGGKVESTSAWCQKN